MVQGIDVFFSLFNNLAIFIALVTVYRYLLVQFHRSPWYVRQIIFGLSFGAFAIGCMYAKIPVFKGVIVDQRNAIVVLSGAFGGPLSALVSAIMTGSFRLHLGGAGAIAGIIGVLLAAIAGIGLNGLYKRRQTPWIMALGAVLATIIIMPGFLFIEDLKAGWNLMIAMALPYGSAIFLGIFLGSLLISREESRYRIEISFRENEKKYRELVEGTQDLITQTDKYGNFTFVNYMAESILGCSIDECRGKSAFNFIHPDDRDMTREWFNRCVEQKTKQASLENRQANSKTGRVHHMMWSCSFHYNHSGDLIGVGNIARDITDQKKSESARRESEARYRSLFESVPDGILIADEQGRCRDANPMMRGMLGYELDELAGMRISDIFSKLERDQSVLAMDPRENNDELSVVWELSPKNGAVFLAEVTSTILPDGNTLAMVRDITERRELEARLRQSQKMESVGRLAGGIAHDFNNILVPIIGYVDLLSMKLKKNDPRHEYLDRVREAAKRATDLTQQILAFSRKQVLDMRIIDLNQIVTDFSKMLERLIGEDIRLRISLNPNLHTVKGDNGQIEQILLNLVVNARDAMQAGGSLIIETQNTYLDDGFFRKQGENLSPGEYAMLAVSDTGHGIDDKTRRMIFDPFYTTKDHGKGTGLGLAMVFGITKQHNGGIWVDSEPGKGTTFKIFLPRADGDVLHEPVTDEKPVELQGTETILVVEDEKIVRRIVCKTLAAQGYQIIEASSPSEGLHHASNNDEIHLLLTDVIMPELNGRELYNKIAEIHSGIKVLYMSGYTDDVIDTHGISDTGVNFLQKPFSAQRLSQKVRSVLG